MLERKTIIDQVEIAGDGSVGIRLRLALVEGGNEMPNAAIHRTRVAPDMDPATQIALLNTHLADMHTTRTETETDKNGVERQRPVKVPLGAWPGLGEAEVAAIRAARDAYFSPDLTGDKRIAESNRKIIEQSERVTAEIARLVAVQDELAALRRRAPELEAAVIERDAAIEALTASRDAMAAAHAKQLDAAVNINKELAGRLDAAAKAIAGRE